jgi:hypothetical protein
VCAVRRLAGSSRRQGRAAAPPRGRASTRRRRGRRRAHAGRVGPPRRRPSGHRCRDRVRNPVGSPGHVAASRPRRRARRSRSGTDGTGCGRPGASERGRLAAARRRGRLSRHRPVGARQRGSAPLCARPPGGFVGGGLRIGARQRFFDHSRFDLLLRLHHSPHDLRHTFASLLLQQGESIQYVQRMLGHASITLTVDTYGKWLPMGNKAAVDRLDTPIAEDGGKMVAEGTTGLRDVSEVVAGVGDPGRARTFNPEIKSLLLYH